MTSNYSYETKQYKDIDVRNRNILPSELRNEGYHPVIRYGSMGDIGVSQWFDLHSPDEPIPDEAEFVSGVYLLTDDERDRLSRLNQDDVEILPAANTS